MALIPDDNEGFTVETRHVLPADFLIRIESFSLLLENTIPQYESREFMAGDYKWRLIICPDGHKTENGDGHISVYLSIAETNALPMDWEVNAMFNLFLYNQISDNYLCFRGKLRRFHPMKSKWGLSKLISKKILRDPSNEYLIDDKCVFGAEVFVIKGQRVVEYASLLKEANIYKHTWTITHFSKLNGVWTSEEFTVRGHLWKIDLHPNGNGRGKGCSVSIYLVCVDAKGFVPPQKLKADFCFRIKDQFHDSHCSKNSSNWFTSCERDWGFQNFMSLADMRESSKRFIVDDCCVLEAEIYVDVDASKLE